MTVSETYMASMKAEIIAGVIEGLGGPHDDRQLLTIEQVMERLQISRRSLFKLMKEDRVLPYVMVGDGLVRIRPADLEAYLATREVDPGTPEP